MTVDAVDVLVDAISEEKYRQDFLKVTGSVTDEKLARFAIRASTIAQSDSVCPIVIVRSRIQRDRVRRFHHVSIMSCRLFFGCRCFARLCA